MKSWSFKHLFDNFVSTSANVTNNDNYTKPDKDKVVIVPIRILEYNCTNFVYRIHNYIYHITFKIYIYIYFETSECSVQVIADILQFITYTC